jgi:hypothetical protein
VQKNDGPFPISYAKKKKKKKYIYIYRGTSSPILWDGLKIKIKGILYIILYAPITSKSIERRAHFEFKCFE